MNQNSKRSMNVATQVSLTLPEEELKELAVPKFGFIKSLNISEEELAALQARAEDPDLNTHLQEALPALHLIGEVFLPELDVPMMDQLGQAGGFDPAHLEIIGKEVASLRSTRWSQLLEDIDALSERYFELQSAPEPPAETDPVGSPGDDAPQLVEELPSLSLATAESGSLAAPSVGDLVKWFHDNDRSETRLDRVLGTLKTLDFDFEDLLPTQLNNEIGFSRAQLKKILDAFREGLRVNPYGILHLERLEFTPDGEERGELVYTAPLAPEETLEFVQKETNTYKEEFERYVQNALETIGESEAKENQELSKSVKFDRKWSDEFKFSSKVSGKYGTEHTYIGGELGINYDFKNEQNNVIEDTLKNTRELTQKASFKANEDFKQTFKSSATKSEENAVTRTIKNPHKDRVMRVDYYRMMRKWKIDLHRYGLRITYDMNVPEPGSEIMEKYRQLKLVKHLLAIPFDTYFPITRDSIKIFWSRSIKNLKRITEIESTYKTTIPLPPKHALFYSEFETRTWTTKEEAERETFETFTFNLDSDYEVNHTSSNLLRLVTASASKHKDTGPAVVNKIHAVIDHDGEISIGVQKVNVGSMIVHIKFVAVLKQSVRDQWEHETYKALRDAAYAQFKEREEKLLALKAELEKSLEVKDTLSLRRLEREELMKNVLRWMFGPGFRFVLPGMRANAPTDGSRLVDSYYDRATRSVRGDKSGLSIHQTVMQHGALIQFLHQAVEWENMSYFLYPYFWTAPEEWQEKLDIRHPDPIHEAFLKAGSARVVLPIRPGFEEKFLWFLKNGRLEVPTQGATPSYISLARQMENFAKTNYPYLRSANPVKNSRPVITYLQRKAWKEMQEIISWIEKYKEVNKRYPATLAEVDSLPNIPGVPISQRLDAWGHPYYYKFPGANADYDFASWGANGAPDAGAPGPVPENEDIESWAESSRIATWYEYTPTSALDIGVKSEVITPPVPTPPSP